MWDDDVILNPLSDSDAEEAESMTFYQGERTLQEESLGMFFHKMDLLKLPNQDFFKADLVSLLNVKMAQYKLFSIQLYILYLSCFLISSL